jgi:hypothetical protein
VDVIAKPVGRLQVLIPELRRLVYFVVKTGSWNDCINISRQLGALEVVQQLRGKHVAGVPLILSRVQDEISTPSGEGGARARRKKWLISIEPDPDWVSEHIAQIDADSRPVLLQIAAPLSQTEAGNDVRDEIDDSPAPDEPHDPMSELDEYFSQDGASEDPFSPELDARATSTAPRCANPACGHTIEEHGINGNCEAGACKCEHYLASAAPVVTVTKPEPAKKATPAPAKKAAPVTATKGKR